MSAYLEHLREDPHPCGCVVRPPERPLHGPFLRPDGQLFLWPLQDTVSVIGAKSHRNK